MGEFTRKTMWRRILRGFWGALALEWSAMLNPLLLLSPRYRGLWLLLAGGSWILLFIYGTIKFLWLREWGYACTTGGIVACVPVGVALGLRGRWAGSVWNRLTRREPERVNTAPAPTE